MESQNENVTLHVMLNWLGQICTAVIKFSTCVKSWFHRYGRGWQKLSYPTFGGSKNPCWMYPRILSPGVFSCTCIFRRTHTHTHALLQQGLQILLHHIFEASMTHFKYAPEMVSDSSSSRSLLQIQELHFLEAGSTCASPPKLSHLYPPSLVPVSLSPSSTYSIICTPCQRTRVHNIFFIYKWVPFLTLSLETRVYQCKLLCGYCNKEDLIKK